MTDRTPPDRVRFARQRPSALGRRAPAHEGLDDRGQTEAALSEVMGRIAPRSAARRGPTIWASASCLRRTQPADPQHWRLLTFRRTL